MSRDLDAGYRAIVRGLPMSPTKIRPIADKIRRRPYQDAVDLLEILPNKGARFLLKAMRSAAANAMNIDNSLDEYSLYVKEVFIDCGPSQKRIWARGRGRADRQIKRSAHITVVVDREAGGEF